MQQWANIDNIRHTGSHVHCAVGCLWRACEVGSESSFESPVRTDKAACDCSQPRAVLWRWACPLGVKTAGFGYFWCYVLILALNPSHSDLFTKYSTLRLREFSKKTPNKLGQTCLSFTSGSQKSPMHVLEFGPSNAVCFMSHRSFLY